MPRKKKSDEDPVAMSPPEPMETETPTTVHMSVSIALVERNMRRRGQVLVVDDLVSVDHCEIAGQDCTDQVTVENAGELLWTGRGAGFMEAYVAHRPSGRVQIEGEFNA